MPDLNLEGQVQMALEFQSNEQWRVGSIRGGTGQESPYTWYHPYYGQ